MKCRVDAILLGRYFDDEVTDHERARVAIELKRCAHCQARYASLLATRKMLRSHFQQVARTAPQQSIWPAVWSNIQGVEHGDASVSRTRHWAVFRGLAYHFAVALLVVTSLTFLSPSTSSVQQTKGNMSSVQRTLFTPTYLGSNTQAQRVVRTSTVTTSKAWAELVSPLEDYSVRHGLIAVLDD